MYCGYMLHGIIYLVTKNVTRYMTVGFFVEKIDEAKYLQRAYKRVYGQSGIPKSTNFNESLSIEIVYLYTYICLNTRYTISCTHNM